MALERRYGERNKVYLYITCNVVLIDAIVVLSAYREVFRNYTIGVG